MEYFMVYAIFNVSVKVFQNFLHNDIKFNRVIFKKILLQNFHFNIFKNIYFYKLRVFRKIIYLI